MDTVQIVIITLLSVVIFVIFCSWIVRTSQLDDNIWIEPVIVAVIALLIYLVAR